MRTVLPLCLLLAFLLPTPRADADSWGPFSDRRVVSPSGTHYVVIKRVKGKYFEGEYWLMKRRAGHESRITNR